MSVLKLSLIFVLSVVLIGGGFFIFKNLKQNESVLIESEENNFSNNPWIEVLAPEVFELSVDDSLNRELKTGDELKIGNSVEAKNSGLANIHFPDGSMTQINSGTKILVDSVNFEKESGQIAVKLRLLFGRAWFRIMTLATPDSLWEVKTTNAVATVRGTAFGVEYVGGKSRVIGSEDKVAVNPIDPATKEVIKGVALVVSSDKFVEIKNEDVERLKAVGFAAPTERAAPVFQVKDASAEILKEDWVKRGKELDATLNRKKELKRSSRESALPREESKEALPKESPEVLLKEELKTVEVISEKVQPVQSVITEIVKPQALEIVTKSSFVGVVEGNTLVFEAILVMSDGTKRNVTNAAGWQVVGPIGKIIKSGVLVAGLDPSVSELGSGSGAVVATWKDAATGEAFFSKTPLFTVEMLIDTNFDPTRG